MIITKTIGAVPANTKTLLSPIALTQLQVEQILDLLAAANAGASMVVYDSDTNTFYRASAIVSSGVPPA